MLLGLLIIFMTLTVVNVVVHLFKNEYVTETAVAVSASNSVTFHGVYVRNEEVLSYNGSGVVSYPIADGGRLSQGETAVCIYDSEEQIQISKRIKQIDSEISTLEKIQNPGNKEVSQPAYLATLIEEKYKSIAYYKEIGNLTQLANEKQEFLFYMSTMQYVTQEVNDFSDKITSLQVEKDRLESQQEQPVEPPLTARTSAYFVSYADGYEDTLTYDSVNTLSAEELNSITDYSMTSKVPNAVGKLIYGYSWKIVGVIDDPRNTFDKDDIIDLYFPSCAKTINGTVESIRDAGSEGKVILTIVCTDMSYDFVQHRAETVEISNQIYEGIRIPRSAIWVLDQEESSSVTSADAVLTTTEGDSTAKDNRNKGVYIKYGEKVVYKKIDTIFEGDDFVVSKLHPTDDDYVQLYDDMIVKGVDME